MSATRTSSGLQDLTVRAATCDEWDSAWADSPHATFFESRFFAQLWSSYTRGECRPRPQVVSLGDKWSVVVPLTEQTAARGLDRIHLLGPAGTYGSWLELKGRVDGPGAALLSRWLVSAHRSLVWRANPYDSVALHAFPKRACIDFTRSIQLVGGASCVFQRWFRSHKGAVKKAEKLGVTVREASCLDDWRSYHDLYVQSLGRWGSTATVRYDWRLFELLAGMPSSQVRLWISSAASTDLSGVVCFLSRHNVVAWSGASSEEAFARSAVQKTFHHVTLEAIDLGAKWFDLNPSGGLGGVEEFKRRYGALALPSPVVRKYGGVARCSTLSHRILRRRNKRTTISEVGEPW